VTPIEVTVDEWTLDTDENRRIRAATQLLLSLPGVPARTIAGLRRVDRMLTEVWLPPRGMRLPPWTPGRLNAHLHRLLHLADLALGGGSVEHRTGGVVAHGFALNMAFVFEKLVEEILGDLCDQLGPGRLLAQETYKLDEDDRLEIRPDLVIARGATALAVGDTKYKLLDDDGAFPNADAYQLITYCRRLGLSVGHLVYAGDGLAQPDQYVIRGAATDLRVHAVDLRLPLADIEDRIAALHGHMTYGVLASEALAAAR
jgi:5-methylcytosine-specific restriction enzyme subunit McrC